MSKIFNSDDAELFDRAITVVHSSFSITSVIKMIIKHNANRLEKDMVDAALKEIKEIRSVSYSSILDCLEKLLSFANSENENKKDG